MSELAAWLAVVLAPYWLGPIVVWLTQTWSTAPRFEPFDPLRHPSPADVAAAFRQTCEALVAEGFGVVADLFHAGPTKRIEMRVALLEHPASGELALAVAMYSAARSARLVSSHVELPTKFQDGRSVSVNNSGSLCSLPGRPDPSRSSPRSGTRPGYAGSSVRCSSETTGGWCGCRSRIRAMRRGS